MENIASLPHHTFPSITQKCALLLEGQSFSPDLREQPVISLHPSPGRPPVPLRWLTDDAPRSCTRNTHHRLQLLSLSTIFEFDGLPNYIPALSCHLKLLML